MDEPVSKSQKKREAEALQKLGVELIELPATVLKSLSLTEPLLLAILEAKRLKSHGAMRRQAQLIGKLMRDADCELIAQEFNLIKAEQQAKTSSFHAVEAWRDRLINQDNAALTEFIATYPLVDTQVLRQLIRKAINEKARGQSLGASKALFRLLRGVVV